MTQTLTYLTEVDEIEYEVEFTVYFNHTHITGIKLDTVFKVERGASDATLWTKLSIQSLDKAIKAKLIKHAEMMAQGVCLQVPEREYFTENDSERY